MQIYARNLSGRTLPLDVTSGDTVFSVKEKLFAREGTPPAQEQRLIFGGRELQDGCSLIDYNVQDGSTLHLTLRLKGGELVFRFIIAVFSIAFGVPVLKYIHRTYISKLIETATESIANAQKRASERVSGAGRRVTNNRLSGRFK
mmetsp:Transcript_4843/g.10112  ORF Transcript_4843/g.10112 Transcript_4843/m.10112 type:complete len:145 (+) Transcript_4843:199-633(+)